MHALSYIQGYLMGDGSVRKDQVRLYGTADDEPRVVRYAQEVGVDLRPRYAVGKQPGRTVPTFQVTWPQRFRGLLGDISDHRSGRPPLYDCEGSFLAGLWDADGCVSRITRKDRPGYHADTINLSASRLPLLQAAQAALTTLDIESRFSFGMNHRGQNHGALRILKRDYGQFARRVVLQDKKRLLLEQMV